MLGFFVALQTIAPFIHAHAGAVQLNHASFQHVHQGVHGDAAWHVQAGNTVKHGASLVTLSMPGPGGYAQNALTQARLKSKLAASNAARGVTLGELRMALAAGREISLDQVAQLKRTNGPVAVKRENAARFTVVLSFVTDA